MSFVVFTKGIKMALHLTSRSDLIDFLEGHVTPPSIKRGISEDRIEVLGMFSGIGRVEHRAILTRISSKFGKIWIVALILFPRSPITAVYLEENIDWSAWLGDEHPDSFLAGDNPDVYRELKNKGKRK